MPERPFPISFLFGSPAVWVLGGLAVGQLLCARRRLRGTTLVAPVLWGIAAVAMIMVSGTFGPPGTADDHFLGYAAAIFLLAPGLAVLGAKRPQNGAWQFIVGSFVGILMLPVFNGLAVGDHQPHVHALFRWLILAVFLVGMVNYLPTVHRVSIMASWFGLFVPLGIYIPGDFFGRPSAADALALVGINLGLAAAWNLSWKRRRAPRGMQRLWSDFRDAYGMVWGLRVAERLNVAARRHGWPVEFAWRGILVKEPVGDEPTADLALETSAAAVRTVAMEEPLERLDPELRRRIRRELQALLRRFVSPEWIAERDSSETHAFSRNRGVSAGGEHTE